MSGEIAQIVLFKINFFLFIGLRLFKKLYCNMSEYPVSKNELMKKEIC